jgi:hypothetical protein
MGSISTLADNTNSFASRPHKSHNKPMLMDFSLDLFVRYQLLKIEFKSYFKTQHSLSFFEKQGDNAQRCAL